MNIKLFTFLILIATTFTACDKFDYSSVNLKKVDNTALIGTWETVSAVYKATKGGTVLWDENEEYKDPKDRTVFVLKNGNVGAIKVWDEETQEWIEFPLRYSIVGNVIQFSFEFKGEEDELTIALLFENIPFVYSITDEVLRLELEFTDDEGVYQKQIITLNKKADL